MRIRFKGNFRKEMGNSAYFLPRATVNRSKILTAFLCLFCSWFAGGLAQAAEESIGHRFGGEVLKYDIGFWVFRRLGAGETVFQDLGNGRYLASHDAKTIGVAAWLSRYRRDIYRSTMETTPDGRRLIPLRFEEDVIIGRNTRKRITVYDYSSRKVFIETRKNREFTKEEVDIPQGIIYDDPMTGFYNFRAGVYGKVEPGKEFVIRTVPRKESRLPIRLVLASRQEADRRRSEEKDKKGKDLYPKVRVDKELVGSAEGLVEVWFSADLVPVSGVVRNVLFWGDITGKVTSRTFSNPKDLSPPPRQDRKGHRGRIPLTEGLGEQSYLTWNKFSKNLFISVQDFSSAARL